MSAPIDRSRPPRPGRVHPFDFPQTLDRSVGGLRLLAAPRRDLPLVGVRFVTFAGADHDPLSQPGLAGFTGALLEEGTQRRDATEIARTVEDAGGQLASRAGWNTTTVSYGGLAETLALGCELLAEIAIEPGFDPQETERVRSLRLGELRRRSNEPGYLASRALARALYGERTYGSPLLGTAQSLTAARADDCRRWWTAHRSRSRSTVIAVGDFDEEQLVAILERSFADLGKGSSAAAPPGTVDENPEQTVVHVVDRPNATQTELCIGQLGLPRDDPQRPALVLLNAILGGKFTSRINLNLRERHGFTYGASSHQLDRLGRGPFVVSAAVDTSAAGPATREVLFELRRIHAELVSTDELEESRSYLLGILPYTLQTLRGLAGRLDEIALYDLPLDFFDRFPERLRSVSADDVLGAARRLIQPDRLVIAAAGPADQLEPQLADLGPVTIHRGPPAAPDGHE
ncbi:MAG TPA: pitrilysin family protein [Thermoanaerobaculia bacterium]|nr:pitrilysin family protein [Thermoanaerobaculia bacterium]